MTGDAPDGAPAPHGQPTAGAGVPTGERLRAALDGLVGDLAPKQLATAVDRLMTHYRGRTPTGSPVLRNRADAIAYAAYRMPATYRATEAALSACAARLPGWAPESHLDLGGGTGAAVWAAAGVWPAARPVTVLDWAGPALDLGRELASDGAPPAVRGADWRRARIAAGAAPDLPAAGLVTVSYVLGELPDDALDPLVAAVAAAPAVVLVEPGTPDGYRRVLRARDGLVAAGMRVLAPCPHSAACPIAATADDWCHFATRVNRSALHRRVKGGELPYEDEKYSYVAAVHPDLVRAGAAGPGRAPSEGAGPEPAPGRVIRRPQLRKGQVLLDVCAADDGVRRATVTRRDRERYRAARNVAWGDAWS